MSIQRTVSRVFRKKTGFSRFGEDQILARYIAELLPSHTSRTVVDIGAGDGVRWSNTYVLFSSGWNGVAFESDRRRFRKLARVYRRFSGVAVSSDRVDPGTVAPVLKSFGVESDFGVLSLDIDGNDYWVLQAILTEFRPRLIVTEINEKIPPPIRFITRYDPDFQLRHHFHGFSIMTLGDLCRQNDYAILELEYNNAFLAPQELPGVRPLDPETAYRRGYLDRPDRKENFALNFDLEAVQSMNPAEAVKFLNEFYAPERGKYFLSLDPITTD